MNAAPSQDLTARQALERMLELIRGIHGIADVTPELLQRTMGKDVRRIEEGHFGFGQRLPGNWAFSVERYLLQPHDAPQLELGFDRRVAVERHALIELAVGRGENAIGLLVAKL